MANEGLAKLAVNRVRQDDVDSAERYVDLRIQWLEDRDSETVILDVGGRWDRKLEGWKDDGEKCRQLRMHPGQYECAYWFAEWLKYYVSGEKRPEYLEHVWTLILAGGRRGGKSDLLEKILVTTCVAKPGGIVWGVSPTDDETEELEQQLDPWIPSEWAYYLETKKKWTFAHKSILRLRSAHKPSALKRGRVDLIGLNEAQNMAKKAYTMVRAPIADRGGLVVAAINPPDQPRGFWVMEKYDEAKGGLKTLKMFEFDPEDNPYIKIEALLDMAHDVGEIEYRREVKGEFIEIGDLVWWAWSPKHNICDVDPTLPDVTRQFTRASLGREFDFVLSIDLQLTPHMACVCGEFFGDVADPLLWFTDEWAIEGDEYELIDAIEAQEDENGNKIYTPKNTAIILDASAWWQDAERTKGRGSADMFRERGWRHLYRPDAKAMRNPLISERVLACNARMRSAARRRALFSVPENRSLNLALKRWPNKNGIPDKRSDYAHLSDAASYLSWRFFPRKLNKGRGKNRYGYEAVTPKRSKRRRDLDYL